MILDSIEDDLDEVDFGDTRLDNRLKRCVSQTAWMGESTLDRSRSSAEMKATYHFVDNPKVNMDKILLNTINPLASAALKSSERFWRKIPPNLA